ncbi:sulfite exporter TauE/SafE family protein [bacterium]|nr:sulfite exporter TauE/SafE family protein [bacterium]HPF36022.1 sulfite exporter TauE/SafE family protein [Candidatus Krumholzibacteria bacterium]HRX50563.1 sulfite exporter TauE/SafE family protein [Candidatus Krumholzibacteria bacterium]
MEHLPGWKDLGAMTLLGLLGAGHCLGMCGPLVAAFPARLGGLPPHLWYHLGRVTTYTLVGALLGAVGGTLGGVARLQVLMGGVAAVVLLLFGLSRIGLVREPRLMLSASPAAIPGFDAVRRAAASRPLGMLPLGLVMGLLPCGLSYAAFARALAADGFVAGGLLVAAFGAGTLPVLLLAGTAGAAAYRRHRALSEVLSGVLMIGMAVELGADVVSALL